MTSASQSPHRRGLGARPESGHGSCAQSRGHNGEDDRCRHELPRPALLGLGLVVRFIAIRVMLRRNLRHHDRLSNSRKRFPSGPRSGPRPFGTSRTSCPMDSGVWRCDLAPTVCLLGCRGASTGREFRPARARDVTIDTRIVAVAASVRARSCRHDERATTTVEFFERAVGWFAQRSACGSARSSPTTAHPYKSHLWAAGAQPVATSTSAPALPAPHQRQSGTVHPNHHPPAGFTPTDQRQWELQLGHGERSGGRRASLKMTDRASPRASRSALRS